MIQVDIPGHGRLEVEHLVLDYNGTLAIDGVLIDGVADLLNKLGRHMSIHVLTADTFGKAGEGLSNVNCLLSILPKKDQDKGKLNYVEKLGTSRTVSVGNGRNDKLMLKASALGIAVVLEEGCAVETLMSADIACPSILSALELLLNPLRLTATLRS